MDRGPGQAQSRIDVIESHGLGALVATLD